MKTLIRNKTACRITNSVDPDQIAPEEQSDGCLDGCRMSFIISKMLQYEGDCNMTIISCSCRQAFIMSLKV